MSEQAAELERLRAALAEAQQGRTATEQQAAVLAPKLEACADRVSRAEARAEQIEQQAAKAAQAHDTARAAAAQETGRRRPSVTRLARWQQRPRAGRTTYRAA
ncbi:hypothetical protein [Klebsiella pneumoniae]|uniref:hypothetical protein n=1 Tax=Klebsiella pneumoniae TaxID=573 RepID=UPI001C8F9B50|nr:hypothetical protein [Klebsiella pneumoniae]